MPAASASGAMVLRCWRARISVGAIKAACRPASITVGRREQRDHGLAGADIALQQPQHALRPGQIGDDVVDRLLLRMGQRIGQRLEDACAQQALAGRCRGRPAGACARAPARARAGRRAIRHRRAASRPGFRARCRAARPGDADGAARRRKPGKRSRESQASSCHSGRSGRRASAPSMARRTLPSGKPFGERIDRLDQRQLGEAGLVDDAVGMHHLQHAVVERGGAGDVAHLADRQELLADSRARALKKVSVSVGRCRRW